MDRSSSGRALSSDSKANASDRTSLPSDASAAVSSEAFAADKRERSSANAQDKERALADVKMKQLGFAGADDLLKGFEDTGRNSEAAKAQSAGAEKTVPIENSSTGAEAAKLSGAKTEQSGEEKAEANYGAVADAIADGAVKKIVENPWEVAGAVAVGVGAAAVAPFVAPAVAVAAGVAGAGYAAYELYENASKWWNAGSTVANSSEHSAAEVEAAKKTLNDVGGGGVLFAAGGVGSAAAPLARAGRSGYAALRGLAGEADDMAAASTQKALGGAGEDVLSVRSPGSATDGALKNGIKSPATVEDVPQSPGPVNPESGGGRSRLIGEGDEGKVYDAGKFTGADGRSTESVWKVYEQNALNNSPESVVRLTHELESMGIRVPRVLETGKTADGHFAIRFEKIGPDGDSLKDDLRVGALSLADRQEARRQYDGIVEKLAANHVYGDLQLKNFIWNKETRELVWVDPGKLKAGDARALSANYSNAIYPQ